MSTILRDTERRAIIRRRAQAQAPVKKVKVAIVIESTIGGTREHLRQIARRIHLNRFDVTVFCSRMRDSTFMKDVEKMRRWGLKVELLPMQREIHPLQDLFSFFELCRQFGKQGFDVVHTHSAKAGMIGRLAASVSGTSHVFHTPHTFPFQSPQCTGFRAWFYKFLEQFAGLYTEKLILLTDAQRQLVLDCRLVNDSRTLVLTNGLSLRTSEEVHASALSRSELDLDEDKLVVGCVGRLAPQKGHEFLLQAAEKICKARDDVLFALVGDGELRKELEVDVERKGLEGCVRFLGHREDARDLYTAFDVLAMSSLYEGLPYAILEAIDASCPVVTFDLPGFEELVINGQTGLTAMPGNADQLAEKIQLLLDDGELRSELAKSARQHVEKNFSADQFIEQLEALYEGKLS